MNLDERNILFDRIQQLQAVDIDHALERGRDYLLERLADCRRRQDEVGQIAVRVKRAMWASRTARRNANAAAKLSKSASDLDAYRTAEDAYDELKALDESVGVCRATLKAADSDIRLAAVLLGTQIYLGNPGSTPESDTAKPIVQTPSEATPPEPSTGDAIDGLFGTTDAPFTNIATPPFSNTVPASGTIPPGRPPSATVLTDPSTVIDLDSLLG